MANRGESNKSKSSARENNCGEAHKSHSETRGQCFTMVRFTQDYCQHRRLN